MQSIFLDKNQEPTVSDLQNGIGTTFPIWKEIEAFLFEEYSKVKSKWHFTSAKTGWSFRMSDSKRVLVYLLPRNQYFKVAMVFGQKATDVVLESSISETIKSELKAAKVYAEGRGIRIDIHNDDLLEDIKKLIQIKLSS
ncbi:DUF3788 domain-containing protein [Flavobacterium sp.]|uniref:DUF3788 domain-containing protein n=1 Tax=Flavobacterium sp. TaxID=239 RepID=UPI002B4AE03F|nr:DUF3788 domain-containing protein [Flavobacterium sp.]HLP63779.1 DUF3788 domain-containing protein [Flavobacterium sp.]